jgi:hypothetical protein
LNLSFDPSFQYLEHHSIIREEPMRGALFRQVRDLGADRAGSAERRLPVRGGSYALPAFQASGILILIDAPTSTVALHPTVVEGQYMNRVAKVLSRAMGRDVDIEELKVVVIFCGAGLLVSLLAAMSLHLGLGAEFF